MNKYFKKRLSKHIISTSILLIILAKLKEPYEGCRNQKSIATNLKDLKNINILSILTSISSEENSSEKGKQRQKNKRSHSTYGNRANNKHLKIAQLNKGN